MIPHAMGGSWVLGFGFGFRSGFEFGYGSDRDYLELHGIVSGRVTNCHGGDETNIESKLRKLLMIGLYELLIVCFLTCF